MLLYHFMKPKHVLSTIMANSLKISTADNVNDPYEMVPSVIDESGEYASGAFCREKMRKILKNTGMICLCADVSNPAMWAHYADRHRGVAFEFEFPDEHSRSLNKVEYGTEERVKIRPGDDFRENDTLKRIVTALIRTKAPSWCHEKEYRWVFSLNSQEVSKNNEGLFFLHLPKELRRIILGFDCQLRETDTRAALDRQNFSDICVVRADLSDTHFRVVVPRA